MAGIHDVFPADEIDDNDPISKKKLKQLDGEYSIKKTILGFDFDGVDYKADTSEMVFIPSISK